MNIVIPMAGLGCRFSKCGFPLPKPLIVVREKPMYRHAVDCLPLHLANQIIFILRDSDYSLSLENDIKENYAHYTNCSIVKLDKETRGQAETILKASHQMNLNEPTLVHNCDTYIKEKFDWTTVVQDNIDGAVVLFNSNENRWSYAKLDDSGKLVVEFREKKVISSFASTGTYFFKDSSALIDKIQYIIKKDIRENNEFYLSTVFQLMLNLEQKIIPLWTERMLCFGTPPDLVDSLNQMFLERELT